MARVLAASPDRLDTVLADAAAGRFPAPNGDVEVISQPVGKTAAIIGFSAHFFICAPVEVAWVERRVDMADFGATLHPQFQQALAARIGADINELDAVLVGTADAAADQLTTKLALNEIAELDHPRVQRALRYRTDIRVWAHGDDGILVLGRGVNGRLEAAFEVTPSARGRGLGRALATAARSLGGGEAVYTQVSPSNVASLRATLAARYTVIAGEVLLPPNVGRRRLA